MADDAKARELDRWLLFGVQSLGLSSRSADYMRRNDIIHIGDLVQRSEEQMLLAEDFGRRSLDEVKRKLAGMDLSLEMNIGEWSARDTEARRLAALTVVGHAAGDASAAPESGAVAGPNPEDANGLHRLYSVRIRDLGLSARSTNCLLYAGISFIGDLVRKDEAELRRIPKFGESSLREVRRMLEAFDLRLGGGAEGWSPEWAGRRSGIVAPPWEPEIRAENVGSFRDELLAVTAGILAKWPNRHRTMVAYHQLDGGGPVTLRQIGADGRKYGFGGSVTRARVEQIVFAAREQLVRKRSRVRFTRWQPAVEAAKRSRVLAEEAFVARFGYGDAETSFGPRRGYRALQLVAELFGLDFPFELLSFGDRAVVAAGDGLVVSDVQRGFRDLARGKAYVEAAAVCAELGCDRDLAGLIVDLDPRLEFLDGARRYAWNRPRLPVASFRKTGNPILSCLCKIFSVSPRISKADIVQAMAKHKSVREAIPIPVLEGVAARSGMFSLDGEFISKKPGLDFDTLDHIDLAVLKTVAAVGEEIPSDVLYGSLLECGFSRNHTAVIVAYSPFLVNLQPGRGRRRGMHRFLFDFEALDLERLEAAYRERRKERSRGRAASPPAR